MFQEDIFANDQRTTEALFRTAISDFPDDTAQIAIAILQYRGSKEVFDLAVPLLTNTDARMREIGVQIIGNLGLENISFQKETVPLLIDKLGDSSPSVIAAAATALGYRRDARSILHLLKLKQHRSPQVRFGVVAGLSYYENIEAIEGLIELSRDVDDSVRNWATFGLGTMIDADTPSLREALLERLKDGDPEIRGEALIGLAKRKDEKTAEAVMEALKGPFLGTWPVEAAELLANPILYPYLVALKQSIKGSVEARFIEAIDRAIHACS